MRNRTKNIYRGNKKLLICATKDLFSNSYVYFFIDLFNLATTYYRVSHISLPLKTVLRKFKLIKQIVREDEDFWMNGYQQMFKYFSANNTRKYVDVLDLLVDQYNNTIHSEIKMTPKEASRNENENKVWRNLYPEFGPKILSQKFLIGDNVTITKKKMCLIRDTLDGGRKRFLKFQKFN